MEPIHSERKASKLAQEDVISRMPENVITNIMNCLPIRDAIRTSILASNWRFRWTMLTELVFDQNFPEYLLGPNGEESYDESDISRILLNLIGPIEKFYLYIPDYKELDVEEISRWVLFLSEKGIKELAIMNMHQTPLILPTHLFSCLELRDLNLRNCFFHLPCSFHGFPNLLNLRLTTVSSKSNKVGKLLTQCPSLEYLRISNDSSSNTVKPIEISKLGNLNVLFLPLRLLDTNSVTSSSIFQLVGSFKKLQELHLRLYKCKFLTEAGTRNTFPCLKTLGFHSIDFGVDIQLSFIFEMICRSPNLQTLKIVASRNYTPTCAEVDYNTSRRLQLRRVFFFNLKGSNNEVCFINSLLACSPLLEKLSIGLNSSSSMVDDGADRKSKFAEKLHLYLASPVTEIVFM